MSPAIRRREPPRARSSSVSPARSLFSRRATSISAHAASTTSCTATITRVERDTVSVRSACTSTVGRPVRTVTDPANTGSLRSAADPLSAADRSAAIRSVPSPRKSAVANQAEAPCEVRGEASTDGSASSGPYVVKARVRTPRPPRLSSCQYGSLASAARYRPVTRMSTGFSDARSASVNWAPGLSLSCFAAASGSATWRGCTAVPTGPGSVPSTSSIRDRSSAANSVRSGSSAPEAAPVSSRGSA